MGFQNIEINNFRGIKSLFVDDFKQINLIAGYNNSGKSSILEAIFILTGLSSPDISLRINNFRDFAVKDADDLNLIFYNLNINESISFIGNLTKLKENRQLNIDPIFEDSKIEKSISTNQAQLNPSNISQKNLIGLDFTFSINEENHPAINKKSNLIAQGDNKFNARVPTNYVEKIKSAFINSKFAFAAVVTQLDQIINHKQEEEIVEVLRNIEPKISKITIGAGRIIKVDIGLPSLVPINVMGDGIRKLLTILTALYEVRGGILLIDEIDNGLHYSTMKTLWKAIIIAAQKFDVQVFATTHNIDTLKYLKDLIKDEITDFSDNVRHYTLVKLPSGQIKPYKYNFEKFEYALEQDIEIR